MKLLHNIYKFYEACLNSKQLTSKITHTFIILSIYCGLKFVPLIGISLQAIKAHYESLDSGLMKNMNDYSGSALSKASIISIGLSPQLLAGIIIQILTANIASLKEKQKTAFGRQTIGQYTRFISCLLAVGQSIALVFYYEACNSDAIKVVLNPGWFFRITSVISLVGTSMFIIWLAEYMNTKCIAGGVNLLLFTNIVTGLVPYLVQLYDRYNNNLVDIKNILFSFSLLLSVLFVIIVFEQSHTKIPRRVVSLAGIKVANVSSSMQINPAGIMPTMGADNVSNIASRVAFFLFAYIWPYIKHISNKIIPSKIKTTVLIPLKEKIYHLTDNTLYNNISYSTYNIYKKIAPENIDILQVFLIIAKIYIIFALSHEATSMNFSPDDITKNIITTNGYIEKVKPTEPKTLAYLEDVLFKISMISGVYLSIIYLLPDLLLPSLSFGGTSLLIVVTTFFKVVQKIQSNFLDVQYNVDEILES